MTVIVLLAAVYAAAVAYRYLFHRGDWGTFQKRSYPLRPWSDLSGPKMVNPMSGWRSRNIPDPIVTDAQFMAVRECSRIRRENGWDSDLFAKWGVDPSPPKVFLDGGHLDPARLADSSGYLVEMDKPIDLGHVILDYVTEQGVPRRERKARKHHVDFMWINRATLRLSKAMRRGFRAIWRVKYFHGVERPNEHEKRVLGPYTHPDHPGDGAGHGTGAGVVAAWTWREFDFTFHMDVWLEVLKMCVHWAHYRTTGAQVHRPSENIRGIIMGWTTTMHPVHIPLTPIGSWRTGLRELSEWFPSWRLLLLEGDE